MDKRKHRYDEKRREWILRPEATLYKADKDGDLEEVAAAEGSRWALKLREQTAVLLSRKEIVPLNQSFSSVSDEDHIAELRKKGISGRQSCRNLKIV